MSQMCYLATAFNQNIGGWNVGAGGPAHRQNSMFRNATSLNQDLTNWNLAQNGKSHDIRNMFEGATAFVAAYPNGPSTWGNPPTAVALQYSNRLG
jgi:surface protein